MNGANVLVVAEFLFVRNRETYSTRSTASIQGYNTFVMSVLEKQSDVTLALSGEYDSKWNNLFLMMSESQTKTGKSSMSCVTQYANQMQLASRQTIGDIASKSYWGNVKRWRHLESCLT